MPDNLNQKALLSIDLDVKGLNQQATEAKKKVQDLADQLKVLKITGKENTEEFIQAQGQLKSYQQVVNQAVQVNKQLTISERAAKGSIDDITASLAIVTRQYNSLSAAERDSTEAGKSLLAQQRGLADQRKALLSAGGNDTPNVGNYKDALGQTSSANKDLADSSRSVIQGFGIFPTVIGQASDSISNLVTVQRSVITGFQSLETIQAKAVAATEADVIATSELRTAQALLAEKELELAALQEANTATIVELSAAQQALTVASIEETAAKEAQSITTAELVAAQTALAERTGVAATGFKLFDNVLKLSVIGAIAVVVLLLIGYFKTFDPLIDLIQQGFSGLGAATNTVLGGIKNFIVGLSDLGQTFKNIGNFILSPIQSIKEFGNAIGSAASQAAKLKEAEQDLADATKAQEVASASAQQQVAALFLAARNASLSTAERKKLLDEAAAIDKDDFNRRTGLANQELQQAQQNAAIRGKLSKQQNEDLRKNGLSALIAFQNDSNLRGKITDADIDKYKKAQLSIINIREESTQRQEKIQNRIDQQAEKASAAANRQQQKDQATAQKRAALLEKAAKAEEERKNSENATRAFSETARQKEEEALNIDYDKKIFANKKYSATVEQLELERQAALKNLRQKFAIEDAKTQNEYDNLLYKGKEDALKFDIEKIKKIQNGGTLESQQQALDDLQALHDLQSQQNAQNEAFDLSQKDLTEQQKTNIEEKYHQISLTGEQTYEQSRLDLITELSNKRIAKAKEEKDKILEIEQEKRNTYMQAANLAVELFGKNTILGKAALLIQKSLAVNEIIISTQKQVAAIHLSEGYQIAAASGAALASVFGIFALPGVIAGIVAVSTTKAILAEIQGALSVAAIVATTISGFATGGMYVSDGRGALLPGYSPVDNRNAKLRDGEIILVPEVGKNPKSRQIASDLNVAHGGRSFASGYTPQTSFAEGGVFSTQFAVPDNSFIVGVIQQTALAVSQNIPAPVAVIQDFEAKINDNKRIQARQNI